MLLPPANVCFYRCLSVHRGVSRQGDPPVKEAPPLAGRRPGRETPLAGRRPGRETPLAGRPPWQGDPPRRRPPSRDTPCRETPLAGRPPSEGGPPQQGDPPGRDTPCRETPRQGDSPTRETPLAGRPPDTETPPPPPTATAADAKHPTGMHSCSFLLLQSIPDTDKFLLQGQPLYGQKQMNARDAYEQRIEQLRNLIDKYMTEENDEY